MSDFILNINFDESKKKNRLIIETYAGTIPELRSKKYSGQLRNVNINAKESFDNMSEVDIQVVREFLNDESNMQISKYQYMIAPAKIKRINALIEKGCLFYKDKKKGMFQIEYIVYDDLRLKDMYSIDGLWFGGNKTSIHIVLNDATIEIKANEIIPKIYINLNSKQFDLVLKFDYGTSIVDYLSKERQLEKQEVYRDFGFENRILSEIERNGWIFKRNEGFVFAGNDIKKGMSGLIEKGLMVYTNFEKKVVVANLSNVTISYEMDWFNLKGNVSINEENVDIAKLFDFRKKKEKWIEYNGQIVILPEALSSKAIKKDSVSGAVYIEKKHILSAIGIAHDLNNGVVHNLDKLINYNDVKLNIDVNIENVLREYQIVGVKWLLSLRRHCFGACLADDMGLGKTLQIIAFLSDASFKKSKNLIIVPRTLLMNWHRELQKFSPDTSVYLYHGTDRSNSEMQEAKIIISTYQTIVNDIEIFNNIKFDNLIVDEAQYIKNSKSQAYNAVKGISASMKIILTGTPIENNLAEFWGLMRLVNPDIMENYANVSQEHAEIIERIKMLSAPFLLRRMKKDVLKELPQKQEQTLLISMNYEQQRIYDKMLESIRHEILRKSDRFEMKSNSIMLNGLLYLQEICCHPQLLPMQYNEGVTESAKLDTLMYLLNSLYSNGHKVVVFSRFTKMLSIIEKRVISEHMNCFYLDGSTSNRIGIVDEFEKSSEGVFLISLKAGGTGLNLVSADTAIIFDPWWNPASEKQAEDRIYRIGQQKNVMIYRLIVAGTIEEKVQKLQIKKMDLCAEILDGHEVPLAMTAEIMEKLILE